MAAGGAREGSGRKSKAEELKLIERLSPLEDIAFEALKEGLEKKDFKYVKLFYEYTYGKPIERVKQEVRNVEEFSLEIT